MSKNNRLIVVIPSYEPGEEFIEYAKTVSESAKNVVVVNDGSCEKYDFIFDAIAKLENVIYLKNEKNQGKGCSLKTAFAYCADNFDEDDVIVTADCDGQHAAEDVIKVYNAALENKGFLVLGSRDFTLSNIPPKSQIGNTMFRKAYKRYYGLSVYDTQTGLRGFSVSLGQAFIDVSGERFEYEMGVLIYAKQHDIPILEVPIKTIYPENPKEHATHYKAIRDSLKIWGVVLKNVRKTRKMEKQKKKQLQKKD